jgi:hypothetical protein
MAKKEGSKTKAVLDYIKAHPGVGNKEVAEALTKEGIKITAGHVSTIKTQAKKRRRARRQVVETVVAKAGIGVPEIKAALGCLKVCGSVGVAKEALAAAQDIKKMVAVAAEE